MVEESFFKEIATSIQAVSNKVEQSINLQVELQKETKENIQSLKGQMDNQFEQIERKWNQKWDQLEKKIEEMENRWNQKFARQEEKWNKRFKFLEEQIENLRAQTDEKILNMQSQIDNMQNQINAMQIQIETMQEQIDSISRTLAVIEVEHTRKIDLIYENITTFLERQEKQEGEIQSLNSRVDTLECKMNAG